MNFVPQSIWQIPVPFLPTTQQSAAEINDRYQKVANCAEFLRLQAINLRSAATNLLAEIDVALDNFTVQQAEFNLLASAAGDSSVIANSGQAIASNGITRLNSANSSVVTARGKLSTADSNVSGVIANGMIRNGNNLTGIAAAPPANPGILGLSSTGVWTWYSAPSGDPFVLEFQVFSTEYASTSNGGSVTGSAWNITDINKAAYGTFKNSIGFPQNIVEESNDRLKLQNYYHYWQCILIGSNTDAMRVRLTLDGTAIGRSLSTQMASDSNSTSSRHFNQDSILIASVTPTIDPAYLQIQTYHNTTNPAISSAARGISGNQGYVNIYMTSYGWRVRNIV